MAERFFYTQDTRLMAAHYVMLSHRAGTPPITDTEADVRAVLAEIVRDGWESTAVVTAKRWAFGNVHRKRIDAAVHLIVARRVRI